jgi:hypothetical protein
LGVSTVRDHVFLLAASIVRDQLILPIDDLSQLILPIDDPSQLILPIDDSSQLIFSIDIHEHSQLILL